MELMTCCITGFDTFSATWIVVTLKFGLRFQFINFSSLIKSSSKTAAANKLIAFSQTISFTTSLFLKCDRPLKKSVLSHTVFWEPLVEELRLLHGNEENWRPAGCSERGDVMGNCYSLRHPVANRTVVSALASLNSEQLQAVTDCVLLQACKVRIFFILEYW